jgi:hypothetical protein
MKSELMENPNENYINGEKEKAALMINVLLPNIKRRDI